MIINLTNEELQTVRNFSKDAQLGGKSNIRMDDRMDRLAEDQLVAQIGEAALSKFLTGSIGLYIKTREERNLDKWKGDDGCDLLGYNVDVKTSRARKGLDYPYNLWVREREFHRETLYILAIVPENNDNEVHFLGWIKGDFICQRRGDRYEANSIVLKEMESFKR